jgi:predicted aspartyl protease
MAVNQLVISRRFPYLPLILRVRGQTLMVEALLDTGFDGEVVLPTGLIANGESPDGYLNWALADASHVSAPAYLGTAQLGDAPPIEVAISVLGDEPIVGRGVTDHYRVILDRGQQVVVEL